MAGVSPRLELFEFRYRDPRTGKWVRARYLAERHEIEARYAEWESIGPPEIRNVDPDARYFNPHREGRALPDQPLELRPSIDAVDAYLTRVFLRRYVTYCARCRGFAAMNGAARLFAEL